MKPQHTDHQIEIKADGVFDVRDGEGIGVACIEGVVWITQSADPRDIIVHAGESFTLDRPGLAVMAAPLGPATIALRAAAPIGESASATNIVRHVVFA
jgi:hypothetical protein